MRVIKPDRRSKISAPDRTTPNLDRKMSGAFAWPIIKLSAVIIIPLALLLIYGQPALRIQYWYHGSRDYPMYTRCQYLTLLDGWRDIRPPFGVNNCPLVGFFPFHFSDLTGG